MSSVSAQHLPPIRREDVRGFLRRRPIWLTKNLPLDTIRKEVETMELQAEQFYIKAAEKAEDVGVRRLLGDLAEEEKGHENLAVKLTDQILSPDVRAEEDETRRRMFVLQYVQPGTRRPDGRLGLDAGAAVRSGLRHPPQLADLPGRPRRLDRRRHQHGLCRSAVGRRLADGPWIALDARRHDSAS